MSFSKGDVIEVLSFTTEGNSAVVILEQGGAEWHTMAPQWLLVEQKEEEEVSKVVMFTEDLLLKLVGRKVEPSLVNKLNLICNRLRILTSQKAAAFVSCLIGDFSEDTLNQAAEKWKNGELFSYIEEVSKGSLCHMGRTPHSLIDVNWDEPSQKVSKFFTVREVTSGHPEKTPKTSSEKKKAWLMAHQLDAVREEAGCPLMATDWDIATGTVELISENGVTFTLHLKV